MPPRSPEPLRRITLNLFDKDCDAMERRYGHGWSERVREMVRTHIRSKTPELYDWDTLEDEE